MRITALFLDLVFLSICKKEYEFAIEEEEEDRKTRIGKEIKKRE